jgi:hypothetical protein
LPERLQIPICEQESLLCQVVGQGRVPGGELAQAGAHSRLMPPHQLAERVAVILDQDAGDELRVADRWCRH